MESNLASSPGFQTENLSTGASCTLLEAKLKQQLKPWQIENSKSAFMDYLYKLFDRDNAERPRKNTYTGLWEQLQELCDIDPDLPRLIQLTFILNHNANRN
jgi:hypothetical protein